MTDDELRRRIASGTTTRPETLKVLYNDGRTALVKHPGVQIGTRAFPHWEPSWVVQYNTEEPDIVGGNYFGKTVWSCGREDDGPLTFKRLVSLVESLGLSPVCIRTGV